jgi:hypothetical protein
VKVSNWIVLAVLISIVIVSHAAHSADQNEFDRRWYTSDLYDKFREVTYWGKAHLGISDYDYRSGDAEALKLTVKKDKYISAPRSDLLVHFVTEFTRIFNDLPFRDVDAGSDERFQKFLRENPSEHDGVEKFFAAEEARRKALYGGRAGAVYCNIQIKRRLFPVLYEIGCSMNADDQLRYSQAQEKKTIGYSTPEFIDKEIKNAVIDLLKKLKLEFDKMRKYGQKK